MPPDAALARVMLPVAGGLTVVTTAISWLWAVRMTPRVPPGATPHTPEQLAVTRLIAASAVCEGAALFAIVAFLVTREAATLVPWAVSFGSLLAHFPGERHWARLVAAPPAAAAPRPNRMIRG
jgi:hypothetical protein